MRNELYVFTTLYSIHGHEKLLDLLGRERDSERRTSMWVRKENEKPTRTVKRNFQKELEERVQGQKEKPLLGYVTHERKKERSFSFWERVFKKICNVRGNWVLLQGKLRALVQMGHASFSL